MSLMIVQLFDLQLRIDILHITGNSEHSFDILTLGWDILLQSISAKHRSILTCLGLSIIFWQTQFESWKWIWFCKLYKKMNLTLWDWDIIKLILRLHMIIAKTPYTEIVKNMFLSNLDDLESVTSGFNLIKFLFFVKLIHYPPVCHIVHNCNFRHFLDIWTFWIFLYFNHLSPLQGYFLWTSRRAVWH